LINKHLSIKKLQTVVSNLRRILKLFRVHNVIIDEIKASTHVCSVNLILGYGLLMGIKHKTQMHVR